MPVIDQNSGDYPSNVWVTDTLTKVRQDSGAPGTTKWAIVNAVQNEFQGFQVHIQAPGAGLSNYSVVLSSLTNVKTGTVISSTTFDIITYREAYINIPIRTASANTFYNVTGQFPDILIPTVDPYFKQTTNAFPFTVASGKNQSAWIDVHIPTSAPSGYYYGTVVVSTNSTVLARLPVVYGVWAWQMPSTATLHSTIGVDFAALCAQQYSAGFWNSSGYGTHKDTGCGTAGAIPNVAPYPGSSGSDDLAATLVAADSTGFFLDHRLSVGGVYEPTDSNFTGLEQYWGPYLYGTGTTRFNQILHGAKLNSIQYSYLSFTPASAGNWETEFANKGWNTQSALPFEKDCDENSCVPGPVPVGGTPSFIVKASSMHAASTPMSTMWTTDLNYTAGTNSTNYLDIMVPIINNIDPQPPGSYQLTPGSPYANWLAANSMNCGPGHNAVCPTRQLWSYQSCVSAGICANSADNANNHIGGSNSTWPNYDIDGMPVANRAMEWLTFLHGQTGELYYDAVYCWNPFPGANGLCNSPSGTPPDPWTYIYYSGGNGDGTLIYPGTYAHTAPAGATNWTPIYLPSIRLKELRDGMQDYEYLNALTNVGQSSLVTTQIAKWITNSYTFNVDPANNGSFSGTIASVRTTLGTTLHQLTFPPGNAGPPTGANLTGATTGSMTLSWTADSTPLGGILYTVFMSTAPNPILPGGAVQTTSSTFNISFSTGNLNPSTTYYFRIQATSGSYQSGFTTAVASSTLATVPSSAMFSSVSSSTLTAQWSSQDGAGTQYQAVISANSSFGPALSTATTTGMSAIFANLNPSTTYWVEVRAVGNAGDVTAFSTNASTITLLGPPGLGAPAVPGTGSLTFNWTNGVNGGGSLQYQIQISTNSNFNPLWTGGGSSLTFNTSALFGTGGQGPALAPNTTYFAQVQIFNNGSNLFSPFISLAPASTRVAAPNTPAIVSVSSFGLTAQWTSANVPMASFKAVISLNPSFAPALSTVAVAASLQPDGTESGTASFGGLAFETTYYVEALALGNNGDISSPSTSVSTITTLAPPAAAAPVFSGISTNTLTVAWTNGGNVGSLQYQAQLSTAANFNTVLTSSLTFNASAVFGALGQAPALSPDTTYFVQVRIANNGSGNTSAFAALGSTATWANPPTLTTMSAVGVSSVSAALAWNDNGNPPITQYQVFIDTVNTFPQQISTIVTSTPAVIGGLQPNTTYFFRVRAVNWNGVATSTDVTVSTLTALGNTIAMVGAGGAVVQYPAVGTPSVTLVIPSGSFSSGVQVTLGITPTTTPSSGVGSHIQNLTGTGSYVQVALSPQFEPTNPVTLMASYNPATVTALGLNPNTLTLALYDPVDNVWVPQVTAVNTSNNTLAAQTGHLSLFQIMGAAPSTSVSSVVIYPNPLRPSQGPNYAVMTFAGLPSGTRLRIYTITGRLVKDLTADASGMALWDGTNASGSSAASGVYFVYAQGNGTTQTFKVAVQR